jgi:hypothetical protein
MLHRLRKRVRDAHADADFIQPSTDPQTSRFTTSLCTWDWRSPKPIYHADFFFQAVDKVVAVYADVAVATSTLLRSFTTRDCCGLRKG